MYLQIAIPPQVSGSKENNIPVNPIAGYLIVLAPLIFLLTIIAYRKCKIAIFRLSVEKLERIWLLTTK
ncbi:hypothetical protein DSM106972_048330 [Dulcicalothrix desertica PCC 7102]|uniref:Uncharacterized protein n=1 Tax=Dulcicalothrix desertica PCC 7102 TaxID=232991 RepID=A0A3S1IX65_9CYAN|nr:hypothetical protein [Dulcicalothrix desertica]RUT03919.1 hypothetical protein DSM106972_048330 [Dulcicalothrix desertica PCC 7102]TWH43673.1 hypothetical protein CAL7102_07416 [Dulcicalothrix desertica PCC 7102]